METELYSSQTKRWPAAGRHILADYNDDTVTVYQAYRPAIGRYAAEHGKFGGEFSYSRMSWIKPNFLWMMYRSGWGTKPGQEITLAVRLRRPFFEEILEQAVPSSFNEELFESHAAWQEAVQSSNVRLQWDPDHDPAGAKLERRAVQLGLRGEILQRYGTDECVSITDISEFVAAKRPAASAPFDRLTTPVERVYTPVSDIARAQLGLDTA
ncbi:MAG: DUF4291 domain-containing protein [Pseudomonadota bacterium]